MRSNLRVPLPCLVLLICATLLGPKRSQGAPGDLYVTSYGSNTVVATTPDGTKTNFATGLSHPTGIAFDRKGNVFVADETSNSIYKITLAGVKTTFATGLNDPQGLARDRDGNLFVANRGTNSIVRITPTGVKSTAVSGVSGVTGLAFGPTGLLFATAANSGTVMRYNLTINASIVYASGLSSPFGLAFDSAGNLYVSNFTGNTITKITPDQNKANVVTGLTGPQGLTFDRTGNLYVADFGSNNVYRYSPPSGTRTTFAGGYSTPTFLAHEPAARLLNISTRMRVQTGDNALIAGIIVINYFTVAYPTDVVVRGIGPSLANFNIQGSLQDPTLEVGSLTNDNWKSRDYPAGDSQEAQVQATGLAPSDNLESVVLGGFTSSPYNCILRGKNNTTGIGVIEAYQTDQDSTAELGNISTRGFIEGGDNVMIGGFILGGGASAKIIVRAIGPSLSAFGVQNPISDPTLSLRDGNGSQIAFNDDWKSNQQTEIIATTLPPGHDFESAIVTTLPAGNYTAVVSGSTARGGSGTGIGLVEIYNLQY